MANWFVRPNTSHGSTRDGTSYSKAWGGWSEIVWNSLSAGDTLFLCGTFDFSTTVSIGAHNGSTSNPVIIRGDGDSPGEISVISGQSFTPRSNTKLQGIKFTFASRGISTTGSLSYFTLESCSFYGGTNCPFILSGTNGHAHSNILINNCYFTGGGDSGSLGNGASIGWFVSATNAISTLTSITITNNSFVNVNTTGSSRGVITLRTQSNTDATSIVTDLKITGNKFKNVRGYCVEAFDGHSYGAASPTFGLWKGIKVTDNIGENQEIDSTLVIGGGLSIFGFSESPTASFGKNELSRNRFNFLEGPAGGLNFGYGSYLVQDNIVWNVTTRSIDGCGILADDGVKRTIISRNSIYNCSGLPNVTNSGAGIMLLQTDSTVIYGNIVDSCKYGLYIGSVLSGTPTVTYNNTFTNCIRAGIQLSSSADRTASKAYNNIFTGNGISTNNSVLVSGGSAWSNENYNCFYNFPDNTSSHTLGANSITSSPKLRESFTPLSDSPALYTGTFVSYTIDYNKTPYKNPPSMGAVEVV